MKGREVAITGMGLVTPLGGSCDENLAGLKALKSGIGHYPREGVPAYLQYMGVAPKKDVPPDIPPKVLGQMKFLNRGAMLGFHSAYEAVRMAGPGVSEVPPHRRSLYIASGDFTTVDAAFLYPAIKDARRQGNGGIDHEKLNDSALSKVNPFFLLESLANNLFSFLSAFLESMGPGTSLASLSPCGGNAIELAFRSIRNNRADVAFAVGYCSWISDVPLYELEGLGILSKCRFGEASLRPFDRKRDGFITGEGGAALVLEDAEAAIKRGAPIAGWIRGTGNCIELTGGPSGPSVPPNVSRRCMETAMQDAGCSLDEMAFISPHGSATRKGDSSELMSLTSLFDDLGHKVPVCGMKGYTGHLGAASDIAEVIMGAMALREGLVPATLNFSEADRRFAGLPLSGLHQGSDKKRFLSTSYGIGGQSSSVVAEVS